MTLDDLSVGDQDALENPMSLANQIVPLGVYQIKSSLARTSEGCMQRCREEFSKYSSVLNN